MAELLLDTHALFWALYTPHRLSSQAQAALLDTNNLTYATLLSAQEIATKISSGRWSSALDLLENFEDRVSDAGFGLIAPEAADYANVLHFPAIPGHKDPMDRLIVAQAVARGMILVSADRYASSYIDPSQIIDAGQAPQVHEPRHPIAARSAFRKIIIKSTVGRI